MLSVVYVQHIRAVKERREPVGEHSRNKTALIQTESGQGGESTRVNHMCHLSLRHRAFKTKQTNASTVCTVTENKFNI